MAPEATRESGIAVALHARESGGMEVLDPYLADRLDRLGERSTTWRAGLDTLRATGLHTIVATPEQARRRVPGLERYAPRHLGEVIPLWDRDGRLLGAVVTVDTKRLAELAAETGLGAAEVAGDAERILVHEIYGHVVPLAWSGTLSGGCPDPAPGEPAASSCAITRENRVRSELGLPAREAYDIGALAIGRTLIAKRGGAPD